MVRNFDRPGLYLKLNPKIKGPSAVAKVK